MNRFTIDLPQSLLDDLQQRLKRVRFADDFANDAWQYGVNGTYLAELVTYWRDQYDWRATEQEMNRFAHFRTTIDDVPIHFIHERGKGPHPIPLILNHGWPWTFWDFKKLIAPLSDPGAHGGDPADAFDVIVPSLPGYGFSTPLRKPGVNFTETADLWVKLMDSLGYTRFATQGGDWGAFISAQLGHKYAERVIGLHIELALPLNILGGGTVSEEDYAPAERHLIDRNAGFFAAETGYVEIQTTKPQTIAFALNDSPVGLLAWILEKRRTWSDCGGEVERRFTKDELIDTIMIYWATQSFGTSARYYYEATHRPWQPSHNRMPVVEAPTAFISLPNEVLQYPRAWIERNYNLQSWTRLQAGGHFGPMEEPLGMITDLRRFFRSFR